MTARARRLAVAVVSGIAGRAVGLLAPMIVMGPMLRYLGPSLFGVWLTAVAVAAMASFLDFGIGNAALTRLSEAAGRDDPIATRRILGEAYVLLLSISSTALMAVAVGFALAPQVAPDVAASGHAAIVAVVLVALFLSFPAALIWRLLQARHAFVQAQLAQVIGPLLALPACLWGIRAGFSPTAVVALYTLPNAAVLTLWTLAHFVRHPSERPDFVGLRSDSVRGLMMLGGAFFSLSIFTLLGMNADNVIIAARVGTNAVAEYGVPAKLGGVLMLIVGTVFVPLWPLFGDALARNDRHWLKTTTIRMSLGGAAAVCAVGMSMTAFADPIMTVWMGRSFTDQHLILLGWTATATVIALTAPYNMVLNAAGLARAQIMPWAAFVLISIGAKTLLLTKITAWWAPWITAVVYAVTVTPRVISLASQRMK